MFFFRWALIAADLSGRTDNEIKNYWHTRLKKKVPPKETPVVTQAGSQQLFAAADLLASAATYIKNCAQAMEHPIPQLNNNHGVNFINMSTDPTRSSLSPQGPSSNYQDMDDPTVHNYSDMFGPSIADIPNTGSIPDPQVNNNYAADLDSLFVNVSNAGCIPGLEVSAPSESFMTNRVENGIIPPFSTPTTFEAWSDSPIFSPEFH